MNLVVPALITGMGRSQSMLTATGFLRMQPLPVLGAVTILVLFLALMALLKDDAGFSRLERVSARFRSTYLWETYGAALRNIAAGATGLLAVGLLGLLLISGGDSEG